MPQYFKGETTNESYSIDASQVSTGGWIAFIMLFAFIGFAVYSGFVGKWGLLVLLLGCTFAWIPFMVRLTFKTWSKFCFIFLGIGIIIIAAALVLILNRDMDVTLLIAPMIGIVWTGIGILMIVIGIIRARNRKNRTAISETSAYEHYTNDDGVTVTTSVSGDSKFADLTIWIMGIFGLIIGIGCFILGMILPDLM